MRLTVFGEVAAWVDGREVDLGQARRRAVLGALPVPLGLLSADDARELLARRVGHDRAASEPDAIDTVVRRCARLPLALAVAGARAATQPQFSLGALAGELAGLDAFAEDDVTDLRSVFSHSCKALSPPAPRLFRLLGLMPGADVDTVAAASPAGLPLAGTRSLLAELTAAHLVEEHVPDRFTFHDLLRDYAAELAGDDELDDARRRLLDHLTQTAVGAAMAFSAHRRPAAAGRRTSLEHALRALALYEEIEHITGQAEAWSNIGTARSGLDDHAGAVAAMSRSAELYRRGGDPVLEAMITDQLGDILAAANDIKQARAAWRRAAALYAECGHAADHVLAKLEQAWLR